MTNRCTTCGRLEACPDCAQGTPPAERLADLKREREQRHAQAVEQVRADLETLPALAALLPLFVLPGSKPADPNGHRSTNPARPPISLDVVDLIDRRTKPDTPPVRDDYRLDRTQWQWEDRDERLVTEPGHRREGVLVDLDRLCKLVDAALWDADLPHREYGLVACTGACQEAPIRARMNTLEGPCTGNARQHSTKPTVTAECTFLLLHLDWAGQQPWFSELAADIRGMRADIRRAIGDTDPEPLNCPVCDWEVTAQDDGKWFRCTGCGKGWSWLEIRKLHERQQPKTLAEISALMERPLGTLKDWARRRWIKSVARDHRGALYSLAAVQKFAVNVQRGRKKAKV